MDPVSDSKRIKQLAPPASVTTSSGPHAEPKAAVTPAEAAGHALAEPCIMTNLKETNAKLMYNVYIVVIHRYF